MSAYEAIRAGLGPVGESLLAVAGVGLALAVVLLTLRWGWRLLSHATATGSSSEDVARAYKTRQAFRQ